MFRGELKWRRFIEFNFHRDITRISGINKCLCLAFTFDITFNKIRIHFLHLSSPCEVFEFSYSNTHWQQTYGEVKTPYWDKKSEKYSNGNAKRYQHFQKHKVVNVNFRQITSFVRLTKHKIEKKSWFIPAYNQPISIVVSRHTVHGL